MAFNNNGLFVRLYRFRDDRLAGNPISSTKMDAEFDGIATGLSSVLVKDGQQTVTADLPWNNKKLCDVGDAAALTDSIPASQIGDGAVEYAADATNTDTYAITLAPAPTAYTAGMGVAVKLTNANTGASTINVNALGAKNIYWRGAALGGGELAAGKIHFLIYNGTQFDLVSTNHDGDSQVTRAERQGNSQVYAAAGGTANAITLTLSPAPAAYASGQVFWFKAGSANTAATTVNVNSLGAKSIFVDGMALGGGEIQANRMYGVMYDGTQFHLLRSVKDESLDGTTDSGDTVFNGSNVEADATSVILGYGNFTGFDATKITLTDTVLIGSNATKTSGAYTTNWTDSIFIGHDRDQPSSSSENPFVCISNGMGDMLNSNTVKIGIGDYGAGMGSGGIALGYQGSAATDALCIGRISGTFGARPDTQGIQFGERGNSQGAGSNEFNLRDRNTSGTAGSLSAYLKVRINNTLYHMPLYATV